MGCHQSVQKNSFPNAWAPVRKVQDMNLQEDKVLKNVCLGFLKCWGPLRLPMCGSQRAALEVTDLCWDVTTMWLRRDYDVTTTWLGIQVVWMQSADGPQCWALGEDGTKVLGGSVQCDGGWEGLAALWLRITAPTTWHGWIDVERYMDRLMIHGIILMIHVI